jgi:hypothetical protein
MYIIVKVSTVKRTQIRRYGESSFLKGKEDGE